MRIGHSLVAAILAVSWLIALPPGHAAQERAGPAAMAPPYEYYAIGKDAPGRPEGIAPGLLLVGGGDWPYAGFRWFAGKAGNGHVVVLRASGGDELQKELVEQVGGWASAETLVFHARGAASDPRVLEIVGRADAIFLAGGDQSNYVRYWKGTPLAQAIDRHVRAGRPIGGTSAGLAVLGAHAYGAMDGGSLTSRQALQDPLGPGATLVADFLHLPFLDQVITDSHFAKRDRLGRLVAFVARLRQEGASGTVGLGIDEGTALGIDGAGDARVFTDSGGFAWLVRPGTPGNRLVAGQPLEIGGVRVTGIGPESNLRLPAMKVTAPAFERIADAQGGSLSVREATAGESSRP